MPLAAGDHLGTYEILEPICKGRHGRGLRSRDSRLHGDLAVKISARNASPNASNGKPELSPLSTSRFTLSASRFTVSIGLDKMPGLSGDRNPKGQEVLVWFATAQNQAALPAYQNQFIGDRAALRRRDGTPHGRTNCQNQRERRGESQHETNCAKRPGL